MKTKIEKTADGKLCLIIPHELLENMQWKASDVLEWIDNKDGSWALRKCTALEQLKDRALSDPAVKREYEQLGKLDE